MSAAYVGRHALCKDAVQIADSAINHKAVVSKRLDSSCQVVSNIGSAFILAVQIDNNGVTVLQAVDNALIGVSLRSVAVCLFFSYGVHVLAKRHKLRRNSAPDQMLFRMQDLPVA